MQDISHRVDEHRVATAEAVVSMSSDAQALVIARKLDKGDALEVARTAGILAAKRTADLIPLSHSVALSHVELSHRFEAKSVHLTCVVKANAPTDVGLNALTGASVAALTLYDMLGPHTTGAEIKSVRLVSEPDEVPAPSLLESPATIALVGLSGEHTNATDDIAQALEDDANADVVDRVDGVATPDALVRTIQHFVGLETSVVLTIGGTGVSPGDFTVAAVRPLLERELPGVMEAARAYGQKRSAEAMLAQGVAGLVGDTLVVTLPGDSKGALLTFQALFPTLYRVVDERRRAERMT